MGQRPTPSSGGQNQTILELIYAVKGLAQALEYMHSDVRRLLQDESRDRSQDVQKLTAIMTQNAQALAVLPVTISDRIERLMDKMEDHVEVKVDGVLDSVKSGLGVVQDRLIRMAENQGEKAPKDSAIPLLRAPEDDYTGKFEISKHGELKVAGKIPIKKILFYVKWGGIALASAGGLAGLARIVADIVLGR
jgi:hypothetical protein